MNCAIYCRVSTAGQEKQQTIESQKVQLPEYALQQGWTVYDMYVDSAISGASIRGRPDFQRLILDMEKQAFEILLVVEHSRITRSEDPEERGRILRLLKNNRIKLASPAEGVLDLSQFSGELYATMKFLFSAEEKEEMQRRFKRGRDRLFSNGIYCYNSLPFGLKKVVDKTVKPIVHRVVHDEKQVAVLRKVYELVVEQGMTLNKVCGYLNEKGFTTKRGKRWRSQLLSKLFKSDSLTGILWTNKHVFVEGQINPSTGNPIKKLVTRPKAEHMAISVPPIFSQEQFTLLRERIEHNRIDGMVKTDEYLLRGKLKCGLCGAKMVTTQAAGKLVRYYVCHNRIKNRTKCLPGERRCKGPYVQQQAIDSIIETKVLTDLLWKPERTLNSWINTSDGPKADIVAGQIKAKRKDLESKNADIQKLVDAVINGVLSEPDIKERRQEISLQIELIVEQIEKLEDRNRSVLAGKKNIEQIKKAIPELKVFSKALIGKVRNMPFDEKKKLINLFIPAGSFITIEGCHPDDVYHWPNVKLQKGETLRNRFGIARPLKIAWNFFYDGQLDIQGVIDGLKVYDRTGTVPDTSGTVNSNGVKIRIME